MSSGPVTIAVAVDRAFAGALVPSGANQAVDVGFHQQLHHGLRYAAQEVAIGPVGVRRVRLRDRGADQASKRIRFTSAILPRWARRTRSLDALLSILYLRGISMGDFQEALAALLGKDAPNLSPSATPEGKKELLGFQVGIRESTQSWRELLSCEECTIKARDPKSSSESGALDQSPETTVDAFQGHRQAFNLVDKAAI